MRPAQMGRVTQPYVTQPSQCGARTRSGAPCKSAPVIAKVPNARWSRWQRRSKGGMERQLQARSVHRRGSGDSPLVARGSFTVLGKAT
jgi:hypothetical protein